MHHQFTCIIYGPTGNGMYTLKLIQYAQHVTTHPPERIIYCHDEYQTVFNNYSSVEFHDELLDGKSRTLLLQDDLATSTDESSCFVY